MKIKHVIDLRVTQSHSIYNQMISYLHNIFASHEKLFLLSFVVKILKGVTLKICRQTWIQDLQFVSQAFVYSCRLVKKQRMEWKVDTKDTHETYTTGKNGSQKEAKLVPLS